MSFLRRSRPFLYQAVFATALAALLWWVTRGGFGVLLRPAHFNFGESLIPTGPNDNYGQALLTAFVNTLWVSANACILATLLGILIAVAGRSQLVLLRRLVAIYIEVFRNTPLLLQLLLWYTVVQSLPPVMKAIHFGSVFISQRGVALPGLAIDIAHFSLLAIVVVSWALAVRVSRASRRNGIRQAIHLLGIVLSAAIAADGIAIEWPALSGFNFQGGWHISPEFLAMLVGLTLYSAAFISEVVRSGIDAVPKGQWEASSALGLGRLNCLRLVILPQATRVAIPPMVSEYAGIIKNSSLAVAIGYPDLIWASNTTITQTGQAVEIIIVVMAFYLSVSALISVGMNVFNQRMMRRYA